MNLGLVGKTAEDKTSAYLRAKGYKILKRNYSCRFGERRAAWHLIKKGYRILERNYEANGAEIDIIARKKNITAFVEVKARKKGSLVSPVEAVDGRKVKRIMLTAEDYIVKTETELQPRFDIAEVEVLERADKTLSYSLHYIENAF